MQRTAAALVVGARDDDIAALVALDSDGLDDALVIGPTGGVTLLANRGEGRFEDVTSLSGLAQVEFASCALFEQIAARYTQVPGGYLRVLHTGLCNKGDASPRSILGFVEQKA